MVARDHDGPYHASRVLRDYSLSTRQIFFFIPGNELAQHASCQLLAKSEFSGKAISVSLEVAICVQPNNNSQPEEQEEQNKQTTNKSSPPDDFRRNYWRVSVDQGQTHHTFKIHAQKVGKIPVPIL